MEKEEQIDGDDTLGIVEVLLLAVGLSMDAFAVSVCKGLSVRKAGVSFFIR